MWSACASTHAGARWSGSTFAARSDVVCRDLAQLELGVGDRLERAAVKARRAVLDDRRAVLRGRVADVAGESELRMGGVHAGHIAITSHLRDHRGGGDCGAGCVPVDDRPVVDRAARYGEPVHETHGPWHGDALDAA